MHALVFLRTSEEIDESRVEVIFIVSSDVDLRKFVMPCLVPWMTLVPSRIARMGSLKRSVMPVAMFRQFLITGSLEISDHFWLQRISCYQIRAAASTCS